MRRSLALPKVSLLCTDFRWKVLIEPDVALNITEVIFIVNAAFGFILPLPADNVLACFLSKGMIYRQPLPIGCS